MIFIGGRHESCRAAELQRSDSLSLENGVDVAVGYWEIRVGWGGESAAALHPYELTYKHIQVLVE